MAKRMALILSFVFVGSVTAIDGSERALLSARLRGEYGTTFNVQDFGAKGNGKDDDTHHIQNAFDAIMQEGHGQVVFPEGKYKFGPIKVSGLTKSRIQFKKGAELYLLDRDEYNKYDHDTKNRGWWEVEECADLEFTGGKFYGNSASWEKTSKKGDDRPGMFKFKDMTNFEFHGQELHDAPHQNFAVSYSDIVKIHDVKIQSRNVSENSHNTLCMGLGSITNGDLWNVDAQCGDDCLKISGTSSDVTFRDSTCRGGHGLTAGGDSKSLQLDRIKFQNIDVIDMSVGVRFKISIETEGHAKDIRWENVRMTNVRMPIQVETAYSFRKKVKNFEIGDLYFDTITAKYDPEIEHIYISELAPSDLGRFSCDDSAPCNKLHLTDITIDSDEAEWFCQKADGKIKNVTPKIDCLGKSELRSKEFDGNMTAVMV
jgi:polygalacturonase